MHTCMFMNGYLLYAFFYEITSKCMAKSKYIRNCVNANAIYINVHLPALSFYVYICAYVWIGLQLIVYIDVHMNNLACIYVHMRTT